MIRQIKDVAEAHGFSGAYLTEEMIYRSEPGPNPDEHWYTPIAATKYLVRAIAQRVRACGPASREGRTTGSPPSCR